MGDHDVFLRHDFCVARFEDFAGTESCLFVKIGNVPKGGSTGSADTPEGVKTSFLEDHSRGPRTAGLGLIFLEPFV